MSLKPIAVTYPPYAGMGGGSTGMGVTVGPSGEVRLSPPPDPMNWYMVRGCGGPTDIVWWKKGYAGSDMNIMQNYVLKSPCAPPKLCPVSDIYVPKAPCPVIPVNGICPKGYVMQSQCPACSVGPGPRCLAPCRISCVPIGTMCPPGAVCGGMPAPPPIPTPGGPGDYTGTCPKGQHFSHCGCVCRPDGAIEPLCYQFCPSPGHGGVVTDPGHGTNMQGWVPPLGIAAGGAGAGASGSKMAMGIVDYFSAHPLSAVGVIMGVAVLAWVMFR